MSSYVITLITGYSGFRICAEGAAETETEAFQSSNPSCCITNTGPDETTDYLIVLYSTWKMETMYSIIRHVSFPQSINVESLCLFADVVAMLRMWEAQWLSSYMENIRADGWLHPSYKLWELQSWKLQKSCENNAFFRLLWLMAALFRIVFISCKCSCHCHCHCPSCWLSSETVYSKSL